MKARLSLKGRAMQLLVQRDQSRLELRRKLLQRLRKEAAAAASEEVDPSQAAQQVDALLDWLEAHRYLSNERFAEARVHAREGRFGNLRIRSELARHGVALEADIARSLAESELARAQAVRARRFAGTPVTAAERAAQARFLAARGFSPEAIQRALREALAS